METPDPQPLADDEVPTIDGVADEEVLAGDEPAGGDDAPAYDGMEEGPARRLTRRHRGTERPGHAGSIRPSTRRG